MCMQPVGKFTTECGVFTDLVDFAASRWLIASVPVLTRRHAVIVASVRDPDLDDARAREPASTRDVYASAVAIDVLDERRRIATWLEHAGARVDKTDARWTEFVKKNGINEVAATAIAKQKFETIIPVIIAEGGASDGLYFYSKKEEGCLKLVPLD